jgi:membrane protein YqaA with SNARE-associated domain
MHVFGAHLAFFVTWWGALLLAALDSSMLFFLPFGIDTVVIYLTARHRDLFWGYALLAAAGSMAGAAVTYFIGVKIGEHGLDRFVPAKRLERLRRKVKDSGAIALALPALMPPPFPLTPFILTCGALAVDRGRFFVTFGSVRLLRFGIEALLARRYGRGILRVLQSESFQMVVVGFIVIAVIGTIVSATLLWRSTRTRREVPAS